MAAILSSPAHLPPDLLFLLPLTSWPLIHHLPTRSLLWECTQDITSAPHISLSDMHHVPHSKKAPAFNIPHMCFPSKPVFELRYRKCRGTTVNSYLLCSTSFIHTIYCTQSAFLQSSCHYICFKNMLAREIKGTERLATTLFTC